MKNRYEHNDSIYSFSNLQEFHVRDVDFSNHNSYSKGSREILLSSPNLESVDFITCEEINTLEMKTTILKLCEQAPLMYLTFDWSPIEMEFLNDVLLTCSTLKALGTIGMFAITD